MGGARHVVIDEVHDKVDLLFSKSCESKYLSGCAEKMKYLCILSGNIRSSAIIFRYER